MKRKFQFQLILVLLLIVSIVTIHAEVYQETSSYHRVYYQDGVAGNGVFTTHYSVYSDGDILYAELFGFRNNQLLHEKRYSGTKRTRTAHIDAFFNGPYHTHGHGVQ